MSTPAEQDPLKTAAASSSDHPESAEPPAGEPALDANSGEAASTLAGDAMNLISEHKGKLAIGVAATLGLMVYYGWREKRLAKTDPEEYALLQRLREVMRQGDAPQKPRGARKAGDRNAAETDRQDTEADKGEGQADTQ
ncbi:hypothetical protein [Noviherbaspirillum pedocola]|uniref:Uncharacterized protein n=1 Tax=Noviherbaspirillum pedocola TaxID=2801341 RepID=A0A934ST80_9BURK|nr:hypothetical protein [Noviherbaspirillum pedocola]MBK4734766.1 hypothetical protein [Noviherbaspirillum pedocola]